MHDDDYGYDYGLIDRYEYERGTVVEVRAETEDTSYADPRDNDNLGSMVYFGNDYSWGDEQHTYYTPREYLETHEAEIIVAVAMRFEDHSYSGTCYAEDDLDDANGLIWMNHEDLLANWPKDPKAIEHAKACLIAEIKEYAEWLEGNVFFWRLTHPDHEWLENAAVDTGCGGYVGDLEYVKTEAKDAGERAEQEYAKELSERAEWRCRDVITV